MMAARLLKGLMSGLLYFCLATLVAEAIVVGRLWVKWDMDRSRLIQMLAVAQGIDLYALREDAERNAISTEQISYSEILEARAAKDANLQLREQSLDNALAQMQVEQQRLAESQQSYRQQRTRYEAQLAEFQQGVEAAGREEVRRILESVRPAQAKALLLEMLDHDESAAVVMLLREMPNNNRAKIIGEFETPEETKKIDDVLRQIRQGAPESELAGTVQQQLDQNPF